MGLAEAALVDPARTAVVPELFWELASVWQPEWTWPASRPEPAGWPDAEHGTAWVRTGDTVALGYGAALVSVGGGHSSCSHPACGHHHRGSQVRAARPGTGSAAVVQLPGETMGGLVGAIAALSYAPLGPSAIIRW
jgi:hypothetical protein